MYVFSVSYWLNKFCIMLYFCRDSNSWGRLYRFIACLHGKKEKEWFEKKASWITNMNDSDEKNVEKDRELALTLFLLFYFWWLIIIKHQLKYFICIKDISFYGCELWDEVLMSKNLLKEISIAYHSAIKRMLKISKYYNNHFACKSAEMQIFKHLIYKRMVSFLFKLCHSDSVISVRNFYRYDSVLMKSIKNLSIELYDVENLFDNCLSAIHARIKFVQNHEYSSNYVPRTL